MTELAPNISAVDQVLDLERQRCAALDGSDIAALNGLFDDDYVHIHGNGAIEDKAAILRSVAVTPRHCRRGDLRVRLYGDVAVITGKQFAVVRSAGEPDVHLTMEITQVAHRTGEGWKFVSFHSCRTS